MPAAEREKALTVHVFGVSPARYDQLDVGDTDSPHGERLTIKQVGELYRHWYVQTKHKLDLDQLQAKADAHNAFADQENAEIAARVTEKKGAGKPVSKHTKSLRRRPRAKWTDFLPKRVRNGYLGHDRQITFFRRSKTKRQRSGKRQSSLAPETVAALQAWRAERKSGRPEVFITWQGAPWAVVGLGEYFNRLKAAVKEKTRHEIASTFIAIRHTGGPELFRAGLPNAKEVLQFPLGHKKDELWKHYVGIAPEFLYSAVELIRQRFFIRPDKRN